MTVLVTILSDCWLVLMLLLSLMIANWWGELAGIQPGRDKSGLGGFAAIYLFLPVRWLGLAILLPSWSWLGAHAVLGALFAGAVGSGSGAGGCAVTAAAGGAGVRGVARLWELELPTRTCWWGGRGAVWGEGGKPGGMPGGSEVQQGVDGGGGAGDRGEVGSGWSGMLVVSPSMRRP